VLRLVRLFGVELGDPLRRRGRRVAEASRVVDRAVVELDGIYGVYGNLACGRNEDAVVLEEDLVRSGPFRPVFEGGHDARYRRRVIVVLDGFVVDGDGLVLVQR
jgi:hypothetical protein